MNNECKIVIVWKLLGMLRKLKFKQKVIPAHNDESKKFINDIIHVNNAL